MSESTNHYVGDPWNQRWLLTDPETGDPVDPTSVSVTVFKPSEQGDPDAVGKAITITQADNGVYEGKTTLTEPGDWLAVIQVSGGYERIKPQRIHCLPVRT